MNRKQKTKEDSKDGKTKNKTRINHKNDKIKKMKTAMMKMTIRNKNGHVQNFK